MSLAIEFDSRSSAPISDLAASNAFSFFNRHLKIILADTEDLLDIAFRLRYQVYCVERGFENPAEFPDGRERDRDDLRSLHALLIERASGAAIGTVRLILPRRGEELPVFRVVGFGKSRAAGVPFETTAEVSRFAVAKSLRQDFWNDGCLAANRSRVAGHAHSTAVQLLGFGLIRSVIAMTSWAGISHIVGMMEPALLRLLGRLGIAFHPLGEAVEHHGLRQPGWAVMRQLIASIKACHPELGAVISGADRVSQLQVYADAWPSGLRRRNGMAKAE